MKTINLDEKKNAGGKRNGAVRGGQGGARGGSRVRISAAADNQAAEIVRTFSVRWEW